MDFRPPPSSCRRKAKSWQVEGVRTFEQGKKTIFNITVNRVPVGGTEVEVTATIEPWEVTVGEANGDYYLSGQSGFRHYFVGTEAGLIRIVP